MIFPTSSDLSSMQDMGDRTKGNEFSGGSAALDDYKAKQEILRSNNLKRF